MNLHPDSRYQLLLASLITDGERTHNRTGVDAATLFCPPPLEFRPAHQFPLLTTKRMFWRGIVAEMLWFISGDTDVTTLQRQGIRFWDEWQQPDGTIGPGYGASMRAYSDGTGRVVDQLAEFVQGIRNDPVSRRHIITLWNPLRTGEMALPPCHGDYVQAHVAGDMLDLAVVSRSQDVFLGLPFNIAGWSLFHLMLAQVTGIAAGRLVYHPMNAHLYVNHADQAREQLSRTPFASPMVTLDTNITEMWDFRPEHIHLHNYRHHDPIPAPVAV